MEILNQKATIILAKMETGMDEKINTNRHQMAKERIITETKEIIVHPIIRGKYSDYLYCNQMIHFLGNQYIGDFI